MKWNNGDVASGTANKFAEVLIEDESERIRTQYAGLASNAGYAVHSIHLQSWDSNGSLEIGRFQMLKYT